MPGKVNPRSEDDDWSASRFTATILAIGFGASQGNFELNVFDPVIVYNFLSLDQPAARCLHDVLANMPWKGSKPTRTRSRNTWTESLMVVTALAPHIGYDKAAEIAKKAHHEKTTLKKAALGLGHVTEEEYDRIVVPRKMTSPG